MLDCMTVCNGNVVKELKVPFRNYFSHLQVISLINMISDIGVYRKRKEKAISSPNHAREEMLSRN